MPASEASTLFRRAALRLRNPEGIVVEPDDDQALTDLAAELGEPKSDLIRRILREWLERNAYLPVRPEIDEDSETDGAA